MRDVAVIGAGMTRFGKFHDRSLEDLGVEAVRGVLVVGMEKPAHEDRRRSCQAIGAAVEVEWVQQMAARVRKAEEEQGPTFQDGASGGECRRDVAFPPTYRHR
jgi:acetyl-CoA acetyltransferase